MTIHTHAKKGGSGNEEGWRDELQGGQNAVVHDLSLWNENERDGTYRLSHIIMLTVNSTTVV